MKSSKGFAKPQLSLLLLVSLMQIIDTFALHIEWFFDKVSHSRLAINFSQILSHFLWCTIQSNLTLFAILRTCGTPVCWEKRWVSKLIQWSWCEDDHEWLLATSWASATFIPKFEEVEKHTTELLVPQTSVTSRRHTTFPFIHAYSVLFHNTPWRCACRLVVPHYHTAA